MPVKIKHIIIMSKNILSLIIVFVSLNVYSQVSIIPQPVSVKMPRMAGSFIISAATPVILEGSGLEASAQFLNDYLKEIYGFTIKVSSQQPGHQPFI